MNDGTATFVKTLSNSAPATQQLWKLDPPLRQYKVDYETGEEQHIDHEYVVTSASSVFWIPETYIFPASAQGEITRYLELKGSFKGELDHEKALRNAGYSTIEYPTNQ